MLRTELIRSCSCAPIADAVLRSLGCDFRARVSLVAQTHDMPPGAFSAGLVKQFGDQANDVEWRRLASVMAGDDMPLLAGFRYIIEDMVERAAMAQICASKFNDVHTASAAA